MRVTTAVATDFWSPVLLSLSSAAETVRRVRAIAVEADKRRVRADYNTGSITENEAGLLAALSESIKARTVVEVGTFIGTSTLALAMGSAVTAVHTCDISNDCLEATGVIHTYPECSSTDMLGQLCKLGLSVDLCFFDGVLNEVDSTLLKQLTHIGTVFAFHDYNYGPKERFKNGIKFLETMPRKGIGNVALLRPWLKRHVLVEPPIDTTLALLVPEALL